jgi:hypothetical protein
VNHIFIAFCYLFPLVGGFLSDSYFGKCADSAGSEPPRRAAFATRILLAERGAF